MGPSIIPASQLGFGFVLTNPELKTVSGLKGLSYKPSGKQVVLTNPELKPCALKQRSPADGRRAVGKIHGIEKMNHCGITSLVAGAGWVKLAPMNSRSATRERAGARA
jgi:hypothetical protein